MSLKERIKRLAKERGISLPDLESELGFGNSTIVKWEKSTPNADKLNKVAQYFGVTMEYLLNGTDGNGLTEKDEKDIAKDMEAIRQKLLDNESGPAAYDGEAIPEEDVDLLLGQIELMIRRLKHENKEKYNPHKNKK